MRLYIIHTQCDICIYDEFVGVGDVDAKRNDWVGLDMSGEHYQKKKRY